MELYSGYLEDPFNHMKLLCPNSMTSASTQFASSMRIGGMYDRDHQIGGIWNDPYQVDDSQTTSPSLGDVKLDNPLDDVPNELLGSSKSYEHETSKPPEKVLRRLAQNREAARKSRLRKKAYIQQLETSRIKLAQLEQELDRARNQGGYISGHLGESTVGLNGAVNSGIAAFEIEYAHWMEEQTRLTCELRSAIQAQVSDIELHMLVESGMSHYENLYRIKAIAARSDVFYIMSGMWRTSAERFFLWMGGFRPSELLKILVPQLEPLAEQQATAVNNLRKSSQQAEDALSQGMEKLQQTLSETLTMGPLGGPDTIVNNYMGQMENALGKLEALVNFVNQGDHLRQEALHQMNKILTIRQAARGLLVLGDYFQRLRALSSLWAARPREPS
ncbi:transcription factor TGA4-like isoform X1 [Carex littledalei]|uniref:Transcription factor TGA4-like isoform X1 n=1 Tax=Carex littledalei TaxID=544730 RepID=A0A833VHI8_9POAL|nr:transcription factor TGA4-like isoform X1 [Carex littledalei]